MTPAGFDETALARGLEQGAQALGLDLSATQQQQLLQHLALIARWNRVYNLTAVREPAQMLTQHLLDSLAVVRPLRRHTQGAAITLLDVGSGAGLPGVAISVACPEVGVSCVDTVSKKVSFIRQVGVELGLKHFNALHARVESMAGGHFDVITSRAFASLADFVALTDAALAPGGVWMAMKGQVPHEEMAALPPAIEMFHVEPLRVPGLDAERCVVWMRRKG